MAARLSVCNIWLFSKYEAELQHGSRVLLQAGLGQSIPKVPVVLRRKMNSGGARNVNWHKRFKKQLDSLNKGGVRAIPYDYKERQYDPNYFKQYWQPMHRNRQIEEKQPESKGHSCPSSMSSSSIDVTSIMSLWWILRFPLLQYTIRSKHSSQRRRYCPTKG